MSIKFNSTRVAIGIASTAMAMACAFAADPAGAAELATATISSTELSPTSWQYSLTLNDVGTTNIGTFWFAWIPGQDYMPTQPSNISSSGSWAALITGGNPNNGYAIQWVAGSGSALLPGQSAGFTFDSATTPQQMMSSSPFYPGTPVLTSFVYSGAPFSDAGLQFVVQAAPVPEPSTMAMLTAGMLLVGVGVARRRSGGDA